MQQPYFYFFKSLKYGILALISEIFSKSIVAISNSSFVPLASIKVLPSGSTIFDFPQQLSPTALQPAINSKLNNELAAKSICHLFSALKLHKEGTKIISAPFRHSILAGSGKSKS